MLFIEWLVALILALAALTPQETPVAPTATAEPIATLAPAPMPEPVLGVEAVVCAPRYAWDCGTALAIVWCESRNDPWATGRAGERGYFQIHPVHAGSFDWARAYEPDVNTAYAYQLWLLQGWGPWSCSRGIY